MVAARGTGVLYSFTVVYRSPFDDLPAPYVVGLVKLDEGPTILSNVVDCDPASLVCDLPVEVTYQTLRDDVVIPVFRPRGAA
ncbi:MAG TPA: OB-fold domain-containing protein [Candidatus Elarobacter sp.]|nr:OB-fold domain-containing protein [Candidatus Elarobacter sp.]